MGERDDLDEGWRVWREASEAPVGPLMRWTHVFVILAILWIPVCWILGSMLVMGTDSCSYGESSGEFKCSHVGELTIAVLPTGVAVLVAVMGFAAMRWRAVAWLANPAWLVLPVFGLMGSLRIAA